MISQEDVLARFGLQPRLTRADYIAPALGVFGAGILVGAGVALLLAPKSGREIRGDISSVAGRVKNRVTRVMPGKSNGLDLEEMSRDELYTRARELEIEGRSDMTKAELADAVRSAS